ncbi:UNVERIFIED_CONTAM: putative aquaporin NIP5-1 [Sesamum radiatum]|uniref:Aquaporin NIP5-1 n=1 Tax=Sesamum radiatum TaxID=300843 RepID=A0AAW2KCX3_SESRA
MAGLRKCLPASIHLITYLSLARFLSCPSNLYLLHHHYIYVASCMFVYVGAEFVGTFILIFAAAAAPIVRRSRNPDREHSMLGAGSVNSRPVVSTGHISSACLNPSVTIAFASI